MNGPGRSTQEIPTHTFQVQPSDSAVSESAGCSSFSREEGELSADDGKFIKKADIARTFPTDQIPWLLDKVIQVLSLNTSTETKVAPPSHHSQGIRAMLLQGPVRPMVALSLMLFIKQWSQRGSPQNIHCTLLAGCTLFQIWYSLCFWSGDPHLSPLNLSCS